MKTSAIPSFCFVLVDGEFCNDEITLFANVSFQISGSFLQYSIVLISWQTEKVNHVSVS